MNIAHLLALLAVTCAVVSGVYGQARDTKSTAEDVIHGMERTILAHRSVSYRATLDMKFSNMPDTFHHAERVMLDRVPEDSLIGGRVRFTTGDSSFNAYDLRYCYTCDTHTDSCMRYDPKKREDWPINSDTRMMIRWLDFQKPERIKVMFDKGTQLDLLGDTLIETRACWHIRLHYSNEGAVTDNMKDVYITKDSYVPVLEVRHVLVEGDLQFSKRQIHEFSFDTLTDADFELARIMPKAAMVDFVMPETDPLLPVGSKAPTLVGDIYGSAAGVDSIPYSGKVTMIDFWYMRCPPCRTSIPVLDSLYLVYKDRGVQFVGVNHWDYKADNLGQLPAFLEKRPIHYPILLAEISLEEGFQVRAHPAFIMIDRNGFVAYTSEGYGRGLEKEWAAKFDELLK